MECQHVSEDLIRKIKVKSLNIGKLVKYDFVGKVRDVSLLRRSVSLGTSEGCCTNISASDVPRKVTAECHNCPRVCGKCRQTIAQKSKPCFCRIMTENRAFRPECFCESKENVPVM